MSTQLDCSLALAAEASYGTPVTPIRAFEFVDESLDWQPTFAQGAGLRVGSRVARAARRKLAKSAVGGDFTVEAVTKGLGLIFNGVLGNSTSTQIGAGPGFQQVHTPTLNDYLPSFTIQKGIPPLGGGATRPHTFAGCQFSSLDMSVSAGEILKLKASVMGKALDTTTAYAAPSYPVAPELFTFVDGAITIGGTIVLPTTTALASGGSTVGDIADWQLTWDNGLDTAGYNFGSAGQRSRPSAVGMGAGTGKITAEFDTNTLRDAYLNQTDLAMVLTFKSAIPIAAGVFPTLQVVIPDIRLEGEVPQANGGDVITQSIDYTVLDNTASGSSALYIVAVTSDTAL